MFLTGLEVVGCQGAAYDSEGLLITRESILTFQLRGLGVMTVMLLPIMPEAVN